jgi:hypothetical protein
MRILLIYKYIWFCLPSFFYNAKNNPLFYSVQINSAFFIVPKTDLQF